MSRGGPLLVVGADGRIGSALASTLRETGADVHTTSRRPDARANGHIFLDLAGPEINRAALPDVEAAFFCAAITRFADCRDDPHRARLVNVTSPTALAQRLVGQGSRVVLLSTNAVYDGSRPLINEACLPNPLSEYGRLKAEVEAQFLALGGMASVLRLTKVLEPGNPLFIGWIDALALGQTIRAFSDLNFAPISMQHAVAGLVALRGDAGGGIYQASSATDISYADAARHLAMLLGCAPGCVAEQSAAEANIPAEQLTAFASLDPSRLSSLTGTKAPDPLAAISAVFGDAVQRAKTLRVRG